MDSSLLNLLGKKRKNEAGLYFCLPTGILTRDLRKATCCLCFCVCVYLFSVYLLFSGF